MLTRPRTVPSLWGGKRGLPGRAIVLSVLAAPVLALGAIACGSSGAETGVASPAGTPDTSATSSGGGRSPAAESPTHTPEPSATPEPTATFTPVPTPTPAELTFTAPDASNGKNTPCSCGPLGIVYADSTFAVEPSANRVQASAWVNVGINEHPSASAWLSNNFRAPGEGSAVTAQVSSDVSWKGVLAGNGAGGTGAAVTITLAVLEGERTVGSAVVHTKEQRESALTVGGADDIGSDSANFQVVLVPGRVYALRLTVTCEAFSGLIGAATHCVFGASDLYDAGYVQWGTRSILFAP